MSVVPISLSGFGLLTAVGATAPATCAAIRCAIDGVRETRYLDAGGEWIMACEVELDRPWRGRDRLIHMVAGALRETLAQLPDLVPEQTPLLLCLPEAGRPGRLIADDNAFFFDLCAELDVSFHEKSRVIPQGRVAVGAALLQARAMIGSGLASRVLVAAVDSLVAGPTLVAYESKDRLSTSSNSNGFIPGEAGAAMVVHGVGLEAGPHLTCTGIGAAVEHASIESDEPLRADGLVQAIRAALAEAGIDMGAIDYRISDLAGEQYQFKEASLAVSRTLRARKDTFDLWHPADCIGEVGAAAGIVGLAVGAYAAAKGYGKGRGGVLLHLGNDDGKRVAITATASQGVG